MVQKFIVLLPGGSPSQLFNWKHEKLRPRDIKLLEFAPLISDKLKIASWLPIPTFQVLKSILCHSLHNCITLSFLCLSFLYR